MIHQSRDNDVYEFNNCSRVINKKICGATAPKSQDRLKWLLSDGSTGGLMVSKAPSLNFNFSFLNRISPFLNELVTLLSLRGWLDRVQNVETVLGYSQDRIPDLVDGSQTC